MTDAPVQFTEKRSATPKEDPAREVARRRLTIDISGSAVVKIVLGLLALGLISGLLSQMRDVFVWTLTATFLAVALNPLVVRLEPRLGRSQGGLGLLQLLLADRARGEQRARPLLLLARVPDAGFPGELVRLLARYGRLLAPGIDLHQRGALVHAISRLHEDLRDLPVDLRLNRRRAQRLQSRHVFRRVVERRQAGADDLYGSGRKALGLGRTGLRLAAGRRNWYQQ